MLFFCIMKRNAVETYSVNSFLHEVQQHVDCIHINTHVLSGALLYFWYQEYIEAGKGQVTKQVDHMTVEKTGWGLESSCWEKSWWRKVFSTCGTPACPRHHLCRSSDSVSEWLPVFWTLLPPPSDNVEKHVDLDSHDLIYTENCLKVIAISPKANILFHQVK